MNEKERFSPPTSGGISLLIIFAVLCLTVFALMSLATVQADSRLIDASVQAVEDYYAADCEAWRILALLLDGEDLEGVIEDDGVYTYTCPISATQKLDVKVRIEGKKYTVLQWRAVPDREERKEESPNLWDGRLPF